MLSPQGTEKPGREQNGYARAVNPSNEGLSTRADVHIAFSESDVTPAVQKAGAARECLNVREPALSDDREPDDNRSQR